MRWDGLVEALAQRFESCPDDTSLIELEMTESTLLEDLSRIRNRLFKLQNLGFALSVDDFGTGYFSPRHLLTLPIEKIKIDRTFVSELHEGEQSVALTRAVIQLAACLGKYVVAEGVETPLQREFLADCGCHALQGNAISVPLPAARFMDWLHDHAASRSLAP
jgi:EAL domain-containing protein (putative c-di-GMP-specific phosphodiesterase class I)